MKTFAREFGKTLLVAGAASLALGIALGLFQRESVLQWIAYGLDIGGAVMIGLGFLTGPEAPRKRYIRERVLKQPAPPRGESKLLTFSAVGVLLVAAGTLVEIVT